MCMHMCYRCGIPQGRQLLAHTVQTLAEGLGLLFYESVARFLKCCPPVAVHANQLFSGARITRSISTAQRASTGLAFSSCSAPAAAAAHRAWRRLPPFTRGFSASACSSVAADASLSDVIAQVQSCVATSNKETGVLSQVGAALSRMCSVCHLCPAFEGALPWSLIPAPTVMLCLHTFNDS